MKITFYLNCRVNTHKNVQHTRSFVMHCCSYEVCQIISFIYFLQEKEEKLHKFLKEMKGCRLLFQHLALFVVSFHRNYPDMLKKWLKVMHTKFERDLISFKAASLTSLGYHMLNCCLTTCCASSWQLLTWSCLAIDYSVRK